jgi:hypothetical protein
MKTGAFVCLPSPLFPQSRASDVLGMRRDDHLTSSKPIGIFSLCADLWERSDSLLRETISHNRTALRSTCLFQFTQQLRFQVVGIGNHFARCYLFIAGPVIAKLAHTQSAFRPGAYGRSESAAGHGTIRIEITGPGWWIERGARFIVGEPGKARFPFCAFIKQAGGRIAGKCRRQTLHRFLRSGANAHSALWIARGQLFHATAQTRDVKLVDGERSVATLRAARTAHKPLAASSCCVGKGGVHDLDELLVGHGPGRTHHSSIAQSMLPRRPEACLHK